MPRSRTETERLNRLAGSGKGWGGGLPLPYLFSAMLNELLDNGQASTARMTEITADVLSHKSAAVAATRQDRSGTFESVAADVLDQMESRQIIGQGGGAWHLGDEFQVGKFLEIIPKRQGSSRDGVTVWARDEREARSKASGTQGDASFIITHPNPIERDVVSRLRESAETVGQQYPVLTDRSGHVVIDGHHRRQADPSWPAEPARRRDGTPVETEAEILALIRDLDIRRKPLPETVRADIDKILRELAGTNDIKRDRVEAELKRDATRSNVLIAETVGVDDTFVMRVRAKLLSDRSIHEMLFAGGRGSRTGRHSAKCWCGEGDAQLPGKSRKWDDPALLSEVRKARLTGETDQSVGDRLGVAGTTVSRARIFVEGEERGQGRAGNGTAAATGKKTMDEARQSSAQASDETVATREDVSETAATVPAPAPDTHRQRERDQAPDSWTHVGWVGVDSGRILLADPSYLPEMPLEFLNSPGGDDGLADWSPHGPCIAVIARTPRGDGLFPVSVAYDDKWRPTAIRINFNRDNRTDPGRLK